MPLGTCDPASRGEAYNQVTLEVQLPDMSGSVLIDCHFDWDRVSVRPDCDGPTLYLKVRNTGDVPAWALLPNKKKPPAWYQVDPNTDPVAVTAKGTLNNLGLSNYTDVLGVGWVFTDPSAPGLLAAQPVRAKVIAHN